MINDLRLIEIELYSCCNRKCIWCPNREIDRSTRSNQYLHMSILNKLINELWEENYDQYISFSRYNEPLKLSSYFGDWIQHIKFILPKATLVCNTNGDYLSEDILKTIAGLNELTIMDYDNKGLHYCLKKLINCNCVIDKIINNTFIYAHYNNMKILYYVNWRENNIPTDRGGYLTNYSIQERNRECLEPQYFVGINYDGTVSPCCNIRNDIEQHKEYILGDLHNNSLEEILSSQKRKDFIEVCAAARFEVDSPCYYCMNGGGRYTKDNGGIDYV